MFLHVYIYTYTYMCYKAGGPGSSVGIATDYGLDGPGIEKKIPVGEKFFTHIQTDPGANPASCTMGTGSFPGVKRPGRGAEIGNEESYNSTPLLGPWWPVIW
jgi:hypothetical protein